MLYNDLIKNSLTDNFTVKIPEIIRYLLCFDLQTQIIRKLYKKIKVLK